MVGFGFMLMLFDYIILKLGYFPLVKHRSLVVVFLRIYALDIHRVVFIRDRFLLGRDLGILRHLPRGGVE